MRASTCLPALLRDACCWIDTLADAGFLTMDLHADQVHGFFSVPVDHLTAVTLTHLVEHYQSKQTGQNRIKFDQRIGHNAKPAPAQH